MGRCLNCVSKFADEIIVVDTGSTDATVEEAKKYTDDVYFFKWCDDFSAARNFAFEKATCDFVMWIDADDVVTEENCRKIKKLIQKNDFDMAFLLYVTAYNGTKPSFFYYRERIMRRKMNYRFAGVVHEAICPYGKIIYSDAEIQHKKIKEGDPLRNLTILQKQISKGVELDERSEFYYGRELLFNGMYRESATVLEHFLTRDGWIENKIEACLNLYRAYSALNDTKRAYKSVLRSFIFAPPRSEACCILGAKFFEEGDSRSAIYWYEAALNCSADAKSGGFYNAEYGGFIPNMQLCVLYDRIGETEKACAFNEAAGKIKPDNENYLNNKRYFLEKIGKEEKL